MRCLSVSDAVARKERDRLGQTGFDDASIYSNADSGINSLSSLAGAYNRSLAGQSSRGSDSQLRGAVGGWHAPGRPAGCSPSSKFRLFKSNTLRVK